MKLTTVKQQLAQKQGSLEKKEEIEAELKKKCEEKEVFQTQVRWNERSRVSSRL